MSFEIDKTKFKAIQKKQKMRNLAIKNPNKNEADVAHKKAGGPKLMGEKFGQWKQAVKDRDKAAGKKYKKKSINRKKKWREGGNEKLKNVNKAAEKQSMQAVGGFRGVHGSNRKSKAAQGRPAPVVYSYKKKVDEGLTPMKDNNLFGNAYAGSYETLKKKIGSKKKHDKPAIKEASFKDYMAQAQAARDREKKRREDRKKADAQYSDTRKHGVRFYDKKGRGRIKSGKKIYD